MTSYTGVIVYYVSVFNIQRSVIENERIDEGCLATLSKVGCCLPCAMNQVNNHLILRNKQFGVVRHPCEIAHWMGCLDGKHLIEAVSVADKDQARTIPTEIPHQSNAMHVLDSLYPV